MATITETGTIDLKAQKEAHDEASQVATNYITPDGTSTAAFHPEASSTNQVKVDGTGIDIIKGSTSVAKYGDVARIGKSSESRVEIDYHSLKLIDKNNNIYFHISDLRDSTGVATILTTFVIDDSITRTDTKTRLVLSLSPDSIESVKLDGNLLDTNEYSLVSNSSVLEILYVLADGQEVSVEYTTSSILAKAFTLGVRNTISSLGLLSYAEGYSVVATGFTSHAEGYQTEAAGNDSHAEGSGTIANKMHSHAEGFQTTANANSSHSEGSYTQADGTDSHAEGLYTQANGADSHAEGSNTQANGIDSHAEGYSTQANGLNSHAEGSGTIAGGAYSHAEGSNTQANGIDSHAEGYTSIASGNESHAEGDNTQAIGDASHSQNLGTLAHGEAQTAIGKYNINNIDDDLAFIIGNGTANNARSNAFTVDWDGNTTSMGLLKLPTTLINRDGTAPSSTVYDNLHCVEFTDADNETIGRVRMHQSNTGQVGIDLQCRNEKTDGTEVVNELSVNVNKDGSKIYAVSDSAAFRNALGASSGVFPTSVGGTGITSNPSMLTNLGSTSAASVFAASPRPGVTGTLPIANGGTGITSNPSMLVNLGSTSAAGVFAASPRPGVTGTLPRGNGGTGATGRTTGTVTRSGITTAGTLNAYSNGVVCTVTGHDLVLKTALSSGSNVNIATLPSGYRPPTNVYGTIHAGSSARNNKGFIRITSDGVVRFSNYSDASWATNYTIAFTITWAL